MNIFTDSIPKAPPVDAISWCEENVRVDGHSFDSTRTPQLIEPIRAMTTELSTRTGTLVKPVQSGGSTAGELVLAFWLMFMSGKIQFNWQDDGKAEERWPDRILPVIESIPGIRWAGGIDRKICIARLVNATLIVQGVLAKGALDSETIPLQINEEVHLWDAGNLDKARSRQTLVWNAKAFDISNAGNVGDQLHAAYEEGTMETWEVYCPGCSNPHHKSNTVRHEMKFRWDDKRPDLGGLRFDTAAGRQSNGGYSLNKVVPTIRYQMPCGYIVHDTPQDRRALQYREGELMARYRRTNDGALDYKRSWTYEGVSVTEIKWPDLTSEWLKAVRAMKSGDIAPMRNFVTRRECKFWGDDSIPFAGQIIVNKIVMKSREGLTGRAARFFFFDKQRGYKAKGEMKHYWGVIRDVMPNCDSRLVWEGLCQTDSDVLAILDEYGCVNQGGAVDCTWDREDVLQFCYRNNINAQTSSPQEKLFYHKSDKSYRIYSVPEGLHKQLRIPPKHDYLQRIENQVLVSHPHPEEPLHWAIHKLGSIKLLMFLRSHEQTVTKNGGKDFIKWEVPKDASEDYLRHLESWEVSSKKLTATNQTVEILRQRLQADHMLICEAGIANLMAMAPHPDQQQFPGLSILSVRLAQMGISENIIGPEPVANTKKEETK